MDCVLSGAGKVVTDYLVVNGSDATPNTLTFYAGSHSTDTLSTGWIFEDYTLPLVSTLPVTDLNKRSVTLNGSVDWVGSEATVYCYFEYGYDTGYGTETAVQSFNAEDTFSQFVSNMTTGETYHYRAVLYYGAAPYTYLEGDDIAFTMHAEPVGVPTVLTVGSSSVSGVSADLLGNLTSLGYYSTVYLSFEYGTDTNYGSQTTEILTSATGAYVTNIAG